MAHASRTPPADLSELVEELQYLADHAPEFDFFQLMRRMDALYRHLPPIGTAPHPRDEAVRVGQKPSSVFAPSALRSLTLSGDPQRGPHRLEVAFLGLFGPNGPLPFALTEHAQRSSAVARRAQREDPFVDLVDMFHQRAFMLLHRAWSSSRPVVQHDRPEEDHFARYVQALTGSADWTGSRERDVFAQFALRFAGLYANQTRNAEGLESLAAELLGVPVQVEQFVGEWLEVPPEYAWSLGVTSADTRELGVLGDSSVLGPEVYERQHKFRIVAGPVDAALLNELLPGNPTLTKLRKLVHSYVGNSFNWDLRVVLHDDVLRPFALDGAHALGETTYLVTEGDVVTSHIVDPFLA